MAQEVKVRREKKLVNSFKSLATAYQEISLYKMRLTRASILRNREFLEELSEIFFDVKTTYMDILEILLRQHHGVKLPAGIKKNGKQIDVLVTANTKLYGSIVGRVFETFYREIQTHDSDLFLIGKIGKDLFDAKHTNRTYAYFEIPDTGTTAQTLEPIISHILPYEKVVMYYGKYVNVITQTPVSAIISGDKPIVENQEQNHVFKFLFEPQLEEILYFFQTQVVASFFNQSVHEGELARHASRITSMEEALKNIEEAIKKLTLLQKKLKMDTMNKKQLQLLSGMSLWEETSVNNYA